jgi:hypothetical protein
LMVATTMAACWGLRVFEAVEMGGDAGLSGQGRLMEARDCGDGASGPATALTQTRGRNEWRAWDLAGRQAVSQCCAVCCVDDLSVPRTSVEWARGGGRSSSKPNVSGFSSRGEQCSERTEDNGGGGGAVEADKEAAGAAEGRAVGGRAGVRACGRAWAEQGEVARAGRQRRLSSARAVLSVKAA